MNEGADSKTHTCETSSTTLNAEDKPNAPPPQTTTSSGRRPRFGTGRIPSSPFIWIDGKQIRSALAYTKKNPPRRVSFPTNDTHLVTGYLEPADPWKHAEHVNREDIICAYRESCARHGTEPLTKVITQLEKLEITNDERCAELDLQGVTLNQSHCEPLEEIFKRVQFNKINLEETSLDDETSVILFDMFEYYESAKYLNISSNQNIDSRGWQALSHMLKKTQCLEQLEARDIILNEQHGNILARAIRLISHLHILKLENCGLSGRPLVILVTTLKLNTGVRELYLADNGFDLYDAIQLGSLLRINNKLQLLDISNNNIQDDGVRDILEGLINQVNEDKDGKGLNILILWNNRLTKKASPYLSRIIALSKTLETLNVGQNFLTDETLIAIKEALQKNNVLLQLGMQSTDLSCEGIVTLAEVIETNHVLQRIDLRDNSIKMKGMKALTESLKKNQCITQIDLDDRPRMRIDGALREYMDLVEEIRECCTRNKQLQPADASTEDCENPQHHSRFYSASSRKISLTCQTLPCSPSQMTTIRPEEPGRSMLEPKRTSGGRLRSPAPSPIPSPVASPIPSPFRNRFVVSRVPEATVGSTSSSASSSPVTPPSFGSLSTCFFPSPTGSSRFRVSVVEPATPVNSPKSVATSSSSSVTIGFNFKLDTADSSKSNDLHNVPESKPEIINEQCIQETNDITGNISGATSKTMNLDENIDSKQVNKDEFLFPNRDTNKCVPDKLSENLKLEVVESAARIKENEVSMKTSSTEYDNGNTNNKQQYSSNVGVSSKSQNAEDASEEISIEKKQNTGTVQKPTSSLERLLALFQHPGTFFSDATSIAPTELKNSMQDGMNNMVALGDKFHQYLKDGKAVCISGESSTQSTNETSLAEKNEFLKNTNVIRNKNIFESDNCNDYVEDTYKLSERVKNMDTVDDCISDDVTNVSYSQGNESGVSNVNNQPLPENVQSKDNDGHTNDEVIVERSCITSNETIDTYFKITNNAPSINVPENKMSVCVPKLKDIPEYSVLEISEDDSGKVDHTKFELERVISTTANCICDRSTTDSIKSTSNNFSSCKIKCDIKVIDIVNTVDMMDSLNGAISLTTDCKEDGDNVSSVTSVENLEGNCKSVVNSISTRDLVSSPEDCIGNLVTNNTFNDNDNSETMNGRTRSVPNQTTNNTVTCQIDDLSQTKSTIVNSNLSMSIIDFNENDLLSTKIDKNNSTDQATITLVDSAKDDSNSSRTISPSDETLMYNSQESRNIIDNTKTDCIAVPIVTLSGDTDLTEITTTLEQDKSETEDLIFYMTDISTDGTSVEEELSPGNITTNWTNDNVSKSVNSFFELSRVSLSPTNLLFDNKIDNNVHRNSHDSGIEETNLSTADDPTPDSTNVNPRESFQESVDSGIESECSSVCVKVETKGDPISPEKLTNNSISDESSIISGDCKTTNRVQQQSIDKQNTSRAYFEIVKCTVVTTACSMGGINIMSTAQVDVLEDGTVLAESSVSQK